MATNNDIVKEMALMEQRIDSMDEKLNKNTSTRKIMVKAIWIVYAAIAGLMIKMFLK